MRYTPANFQMLSPFLKLDYFIIKNDVFLIILTAHRSPNLTRIIQNNPCLITRNLIYKILERISNLPSASKLVK